VTTREDWLFRAHTLREAANRLRNSAAQLVTDARRYEEGAEDASRMALTYPQPPAEGK
jgi:hypothetical protein